MWPVLPSELRSGEWDSSSPRRSSPTFLAQNDERLLQENDLSDTALPVSYVLKCWLVTHADYLRVAGVLGDPQTDQGEPSSRFPESPA